MPTPLFNLDNNKQFEVEIGQWLLSLDFNCVVLSGANDYFTTLAVLDGDKQLLDIKLITLKSWDLETSKEELSAYRYRQVELRNSNISSIIIWEDLWNGKKDIIKSRIKSILGRSDRIPARLTKSVRIDKETASHFLSKNHLQGYVQAKYKYGLYLPAKYFRVLPSDYQFNAVNDKVLVAVATFSRPRIFQKDDKPFRSYELIRFASLVDITVVGGLDKLLNAFTKDVEPDDIMTYADKEWSDGRSYERLGFVKISELGPVMFSLNIKTNERHSFQKTVSGENLIELCNGGSIKFVKSINK